MPAKRLGELKHQAHQLLNKVWNYHDKEERKQMYKWLIKQNGKGHISLMNEHELEELIRRIPKGYVSDNIWNQIKSTNRSHEN